MNRKWYDTKPLETMYFFKCCSLFSFVLRHQWLSLSVSIGWISRTQFEETWATLLGVLVTQPIVMDQEENQQEVMYSLYI